MKVLVVTYKADISGGSNRAMLEVIDALIEQNHEVSLIVPRKNGALYKEAAKRKIDCIYVPYTRVGIMRPQGKLICLVEHLRMELKLLHDWLIAYKLKNNLKEKKYDIVYSNGSATHFGRILSKQLGIPHVWHIREFFGIDQLLPWRAYQRMNDRTDKYIVISNAMRDIYERKLGIDKVVMISDGVPVPPEYCKKTHDGFRILLAGRIAPAKLQLDAVKGFETFRKMVNGADVKLFLAGTPVTENDIKYKTEIDIYIKEKGLERDVVFLGQVSDMVKLRAEMDIELMCSEREPFGRVTLEGMRAGLPVIGTASGGTLDIIEENVSGLFYQPGNTEELGKKIYQFYKDPEYLKKMSASAEQYGRTHFTERQLLLVVELLEQTLKENKRG